MDKHGLRSYVGQDAPPSSVPQPFGPRNFVKKLWLERLPDPWGR
jgi:hypothetical protein